MPLLYRAEAPSEWGKMQAPAGGETGTATVSPAGRPEIFYRFWRSGAPATVLFLHGLGAHSGWFIDMGNSLAAKGINFYAMDHHGFGKSGGTRGHTSRWSDYVTDIDAVVGKIQADLPDTHLFVMGHSMGGVFAIHYAAAQQAKLRGLLLLNPWIGDTAKVSLGSVLSIVLGGMRGSSQIVELPDSGMTDGMTANPDATLFLQSDPLWVRNRTKGFYWQILQMRGQTLRLATKIIIPTLVMQAEQDKSVTIGGTRQAFDRLASADKTYLPLPGYDHDSEFQADRSLMDTAISDWIAKH
jgi:alpha-beta hydrolase superfamily lysophospholipase